MNSQLLTIVVPIYNEANHLEDFLQKLFEVNFDLQTEFVFIDDHSQDNSWEILKKFESNTVKLFKQSYNQGKGAALHKGFSIATGSILIVQDADFEYNPVEINKLIKPIVQNKYSVVYGNRFHGPYKDFKSGIHRFMNKSLTLLSNFCSGLYVKDMETCYKVFTADTLKGMKLESKRFGFEPEFTAKIAAQGIKVLNIDITYEPRTYKEGKKINWKDGVAALWFILKYNFMTLRKPSSKQR